MARTPSSTPAAPPAAAPEAVKLRLTIAYDGTNYAGWQVQKIGTGVQEVVEQALARVIRGTHRLHSSSRTDTGVHALGMVAHVELPKARLQLPPEKLRLALNAHLPEDIRVIEVRPAKPEFHARFDARGKEYRYFVWNHPAMNPLLRSTAWHVPRSLDVRRMKQAATALVGRHDFRSFAANRGYDFPDTVRTLTRCEVRGRGPLLTFVIEGDGFLYRMCRGMVGTLVQVGLGRFAPHDVGQMLQHHDRRSAGMTAPAQGLVLWKVRYARTRDTRTSIQRGTSAREARGRELEE